jgi:prevent-host-death family protein
MGSGLVLEVGAFEAKNKLSALLDRVEMGEVIIITRHGKPVAKLIPDTAGSDSSQAYAASRRIRARAKQIKPVSFDWQTLKIERDAGRP